MSKEIYLAGGCFWGTEHFIKQIEGVTDTEVGFANGRGDHPSYKEVYTDATGFAETVRVVYAPEVVSLRFLLSLYFEAIDPTSLNKQGEDEGTRYRTGIYYTDESDLPVIREAADEVSRTLTGPLMVEICPLENYFAAEEEHQDYLSKHPDGYCHLSPALFAMARAAKDKNNRN